MALIPANPSMSRLKVCIRRDHDTHVRMHNMHTLVAGDVFDVTRKSDVYGPGKTYNIFAGKDGSRGLGMSSLKPEDAVPDYSTLLENEKKVLDDWHGFFSCVSSYPHAICYVFEKRLIPITFLYIQETLQRRWSCHGPATCGRPSTLEKLILTQTCHNEI